MNEFYIILIEVIAVILVGVYSVLSWHFFGRDPKRKTAVPEFIEPDYISSMFVAYINGERNSKEILKIGILSLMLKGYISQVDEAGTGNRKYVLNQKNRDDLKLRKETLFQEENNLLGVLSENELFENKLGIIGYKNRIVHFLEKKYKNMIYKNNYSYFTPFILGTGICVVFTLSKLMKKDIASSIILTIFIFGWLAYVYGMQRGILKFLYVTITVGGLIGVILYADIFSGIILLILGIMFLIYEKTIGKYTVSGRRKMEYIEGLKMYFETAEKNRMDKFETEEEKINYFNRIFPYIIALKMEDKKIEIFNDSLNFFNMRGNYVETENYVDEFLDFVFPLRRLQRKCIFWLKYFEKS